MPDLRSLSRFAMRGHPEVSLDSAEASQVSGLRRNDKRKVFNRRFNKADEKRYRKGGGNV